MLTRPPTNAIPLLDCKLRPLEQRLQNLAYDCAYGTRESTGQGCECDTCPVLPQCKEFWDWVSVKGDYEVKRGKRIEDIEAHFRRIQAHKERLLGREHAETVAMG